MWKYLFPPKPHPEDTNEPATYGAKLLVVFGLLSMLWAGWALFSWARCIHFVETDGYVEHSSSASRRTSYRAAIYTYTVAGKKYSSDSLAIGGRPVGAIPPQGAVKVYYDPANPARSTLYKFPSETVYLALIIGLAAPRLARWVWDSYA
jgi:hypothetical protein